MIREGKIEDFVKKLISYSEDSTLVFGHIMNEGVEIFNLMFGAFMLVVYGGGVKRGYVDCKAGVFLDLLEPAQLSLV